ncbi:MAG: GIY-YIG nuclease family protein [Patescibacteria group bacterium]|nr:GIY-YIG nuclease family protein [Patescibacteria group bacterium]MCL5093697.1 GIY-YIG nuclease family protein [Patescibacteria group bacterium]
MKSQIYYTYIMANQRPTLYTGMTNDLIKRVYQHKKEVVKGFTEKYHIHKLVYFECFKTPLEAIIREKQIKNMKREEKLRLIKKENPNLMDLYERILDKPE